MSTPSDADPKDPAVAFGLQVVKSFRNAYENLGLTFLDLVYVTQGLTGHMLAWEMDRQIDLARANPKGPPRGAPPKDDFKPTEFDPGDPEGDEWKRPD